VANVNAVTTLVLAVNVALVAPAGTVTLGGTATSVGLLLVSGTNAPPGGAGARNSSVPVFEVPPATVSNPPKFIPPSNGITPVSAAALKPFKVARTLTNCGAVTWLAVA